MGGPPGGSGGPRCGTGCGEQRCARGRPRGGCGVPPPPAKSYSGQIHPRIGRSCRTSVRTLRRRRSHRRTRPDSAVPDTCAARRRKRPEALPERSAWWSTGRGTDESTRRIAATTHDRAITDGSAVLVSTIDAWIPNLAHCAPPQMSLGRSSGHGMRFDAVVRMTVRWPGFIASGLSYARRPSPASATMRRLLRESGQGRGDKWVSEGQPSRWIAKLEDCVMKTEQPGNPAGRSNRARSVDVTIVGAGLSGIGAAWRLRQRLPEEIS